MCRMCLVDIDTGRGPALGVSCMVTVAEGMKVETDERAGEEGPGGRARVPPHQPPARLPGVRQGRRVPAAGPDHEPRVRARAGSWRRSATTRSPSPSATSSSSTASAASCATGAPASPRRWRATRSSTSPIGATRPRSSRSPTSRSPRTSAATPCRSARSGALTAKPYRFKARPWDLDEAESTCTTCSVGCRITVQSSRNELLRYQGVDSDPVNWGWLCDKRPLRLRGGEQRASGLAQAVGAPGPRRCVDRSSGHGPSTPRRAPRCSRPWPRAVRARSPSSAAPAAPTRTPTRGPSWPRACSAPTTSTPSSATG